MLCLFLIYWRIFSRLLIYMCCLYFKCGFSEESHFWSISLLTFTTNSWLCCSNGTFSSALKSTSCQSNKKTCGMCYSSSAQPLLLSLSCVLFEGPCFQIRHLFYIFLHCLWCAIALKPLRIKAFVCTLCGPDYVYIDMYLTYFCICFKWWSFRIFASTTCHLNQHSFKWTIILKELSN